MSQLEQMQQLQNELNVRFPALDWKVGAVTREGHQEVTVRASCFIGYPVNATLRAITWLEDVPLDDPIVYTIIIGDIARSFARALLEWRPDDDSP